MVLAWLQRHREPRPSSHVHRAIIEFQQGTLTLKYHQLGNSGLKVSSLCLGCMSFGAPEEGWHAWTLNDEQSRPMSRTAIAAGINFFDTANAYAGGSSEEILGRALKDFARREEVVIATKVFAPMRKDANSMGLSRKAIMTEIDASLRRLGTDHVDLYQIHRFDDSTPMEETLEALHDVVRAGKARYIGASSMYAWQFAQMLAVSERHGWTRFISMQNHLNLVYREEEREMLPLCKAEGIGVMPWSPLARGLLTRPWQDKPNTARAEKDDFARHLYAATQHEDKLIVDELTRVAAELNVPQAQLALAWVMGKPGVTSPIVGATKLAQLQDAIAAMALTLTPEVRQALEAPYRPRQVAGIR
jgi:aryl-alcohol dehydrogenase-like predicted oxidoreductase